MTTPAAGQRHRFLFVSSNSAPWGGSEELWSATAAALAEQGHIVSALKPNLDEANPRIRRLRELSCRVRDLTRLPWIGWGAPRGSMRPNAFALRSRALNLALTLATSRTDLVVISQGANLDGVYLGSICRRLKKPYVLIAQKATDAYWPADGSLARMRAVYQQARACFFVSAHNRRLTEEQLGIDLPHGSVVRNPFLVAWNRKDTWPAEDGWMRLACVGRLYAAEKGQDILLRVLSREKWRQRSLSVTFFGSGPNAIALERMAHYLGVKNVSFRGFVDDVAAIWAGHHGLVLPSRAEGLPLVLVEAMLAARVPIVTDVAGNGEVVVDGETGFLASAAHEDALDDALDRAWERRDEWRAIGQRAASEIRQLVPRDPAGVFAETLTRLTSKG